MSQRLDYEWSGLSLPFQYLIITETEQRDSLQLKNRRRERFITTEEPEERERLGGRKGGRERWSIPRTVAPFRVVSAFISQIKSTFSSHTEREREKGLKPSRLI